MEHVCEWNVCGWNMCVCEWRVLQVLAPQGLLGLTEIRQRIVAPVPMASCLHDNLASTCTPLLGVKQDSQVGGKLIKECVLFCLYTYMCIHMSLCVFVGKCACVCWRMCSCMWVHMDVYVLVHKYMPLCAGICACACVCVC